MTSKYSFSLVESWDISQVGNWLKSVSHSNYIQTFAENEIDGSILLDLTDSHFVDMGILLLGHRIILKNTLRKLRLECIRNLAIQRMTTNNRSTNTTLNSRIAPSKTFNTNTSSSLPSSKSDRKPDNILMGLPFVKGAKQESASSSISSHAMLLINTEDGISRFKISDFDSLNHLKNIFAKKLNVSSEEISFSTTTKGESVSENYFLDILAANKTVSLNCSVTPAVTLRDRKTFFGNRPPSEQILNPKNLDIFFPEEGGKIKATINGVTNTQSSIVNYRSSIADPSSTQLGIQKWVQGKLLGAGSFGKVYIGLNPITGELMAVKKVEILERDHKNRKLVDSLQQEISLLKDLSHPNIVRYIGYKLDSKEFDIFLEYVPGGSIAGLLSQCGSFEEPLVKRFTGQVLRGLDYLHSKNIIHRDIKGGNILIDDKGRLKISDFGLSVKDSALGNNARVSLKGSIFWMAPEVIRDHLYSVKADIWSLGCLIIEMLTGSHPWPDFAHQTVIFKIGTSERPPIPDSLSTNLNRFLGKCFEIDHQMRPSASTLLASTWITEK